MTWQDEILKGHENDKSIFDTMTTTVIIPNENESEFEHALMIVMGYEIESKQDKGSHTTFNVKIKNKTDQNSVEVLAELFKK